MEDQKLPPYQRLKTILNEGNDALTDKAADNLNKLLGIDDESKKNTFLSKVINFFKVLDSKIFSKKSRMYNSRYQGRVKNRRKYS